ncbi:MAG TPA: RNA 2'-phosphotransferase [Segetibacter sp.]
MLSTKQLTSVSKFISLVLRHKPETIGLTLDANGWAATTELIDKMNSNGKVITFEVLDLVVAENSKKRFSFNDDKTKIRASQGHSLEVDLQLQPVKPPVELYHGTSVQSVSSILKTGLEKRQRQYVHLSPDKETAMSVGRRHGKPAVLLVDAAKMEEDGFAFYLSENKVWLTESVPAKYLSLL